MYSGKVMEHFRNPRNVGEIPDADGIGEVGNPVCGDMMAFYIKVKDNRLEDIKFKTFGCGAAIAVSSMISEMAKGKTLDEAMKITNKMVAEELDGLPKNKLHCSNLGADALHRAIENYLNKGSSKGTEEKEEADEKEKKLEQKAESKCNCPICDLPLKEEEMCIGCGVLFRSCPFCEKPIPKEAKICPECKKEILDN